jgi:hypothetical protein
MRLLIASSNHPYEESQLECPTPVVLWHADTVQQPVNASEYPECRCDS